MIQFVERIFKNRIIRIAVICVLSLMALVSTVQGARNAAKVSQDFQWDAAKALSMQINPYTESLSPTGALKQEGIKEFYDYFDSIDAPQKMEANQFPSLLMLLLPYTWMPPMTAKIAWLITNLLCTAGIVLLLRKTYLKDLSRYGFALAVLLMLAGTPYRNQLGVGQHTLFSFFFFLLAVWTSEKDLTICSGLSLAVSYFKYTLTAPLALYFVYKKKWKELGISVGIHVLLTEVAALWLKDSFMNMLLLPLKVSSALASEGGLDFGALLNGSPISFVLAFVVMLILLVLMLRLEDGYDSLVITVLMLWSLIITYHRTYDFFVLVLAAGAFAGVFTMKSGKQALFAGYLVVVFTIFFLLRLFHESVPARMLAGAVYYTFTVVMTVVLIEGVESAGKKRDGIISNKE